LYFITAAVFNCYSASGRRDINKLIDCSLRTAYSDQSINQSINQSKQICTAPCVASESEAQLLSTSKSVAQL